MNLFLAITDNDWFRFLRRRPEVDEVNFWRPHGQRFKALGPGDPLLFKLHSPQNFVVGGGFFAHASALPASLAWEAFGEPMLVRPRLGQGSYPGARHRRLPAAARDYG